MFRPSSYSVLWYVPDRFGGSKSRNRIRLHAKTSAKAKRLRGCEQLVIRVALEAQGAVWCVIPVRVQLLYDSRWH